jgi:uncharacterized protein (DUF1684 family)
MPAHLLFTGRTTVVAVAVFLVACAGGGTDRQPAAVPPNYVADVEAWREKHEQDYRREYVTIAGLHFLDPGAHTVGRGPGTDIVLSAHVPPTIGRLSVADGFVRFEPAPGVPVEHRGKRVTGSVTLKEPGKPAAEELIIGDVRLAIHQSGPRLSLRVWDPNGEPATAFKGFAWFPIDPSYRVTARFIPDDKPQTLTVLNTFNDETTYTSEGVVEFALQGRTVRLRPFTTRPRRFYFVLRDASSGIETYGTGRFLYSDLLDNGTTVLDFNQAYNPPCAFNPYTTCPIPLKENIIPVRILAGERDYGSQGLRTK